MNSLIKLILGIALIALSFSSMAKNYAEIEWVELIPQSDLDALLNPPESITSIPHGLEPTLENFDQLSSSIEQAIGSAIEEKVPTPEEQAYQAALNSTNVNDSMDKKEVRIPGFIVPVEYDDKQVVTEFFLVPYFGACIHVPPPPPNQIIYVKYPEGLTLDALYDPFWIEGQLSTEIIENTIALSAYTISADGVKPYTEYAK